MKYSAVIGYLILFVIFLAVCYIEKRDLSCPKPGLSKEECRERGGMAYSDTRPQPSDTCRETVDKMIKAGTAAHRLIKWRISAIMAFIIALVLWILVVTPGRLPSPFTFALTILMIMLCVLGMFIFYDYHVLKEPGDFVESLGEKLKRDCI